MYVFYVLTYAFFLSDRTHQRRNLDRLHDLTGLRPIPESRVPSIFYTQRMLFSRLRSKNGSLQY